MEDISDNSPRKNIGFLQAKILSIIKPPQAYKKLFFFFLGVCLPISQAVGNQDSILLHQRRA